MKGGDVCVYSCGNFASKPEDSFALSCNKYYAKQVAIFGGCYSS
jgi:hypothetical protein